MPGSLQASPGLGNTSAAKLVIDACACQVQLGRNILSRTPQELSGHRSEGLAFPALLRPPWTWRDTSRDGILTN